MLLLQFFVLILNRYSLYTSTHPPITNEIHERSINASLICYLLSIVFCSGSFFVPQIVWATIYHCHISPTLSKKRTNNFLLFSAATKLLLLLFIVSVIGSEYEYRAHCTRKLIWVWRGDAFDFFFFFLCVLFSVHPFSRARSFGLFSCFFFII